MSALKDAFSVDFWDAVTSFSDQIDEKAEELALQDCSLALAEYQAFNERAANLLAKLEDFFGPSSDE
ncbi:MAG: hypothetical protein R2827_01630 [Bdellovibrionales bacterium]